MECLPCVPLLSVFQLVSAKVGHCQEIQVKKRQIRAIMSLLGHSCPGLQGCWLGFILVIPPVFYISKLWSGWFGDTSAPLPFQGQPRLPAATYL